MDGSIAAVKVSALRTYPRWSMLRSIVVPFLTVAAISATLGAGGLVVAPHRVPVGTPATHEHPVTALRFPLLMLVEGPLVPAQMRSHREAFHAAHSSVGATDTVLVEVTALHPLELLAGGIVVALLTLTIPRLPRPNLRAVAVVGRPRLPATQWRLPRLDRPPRVAVFVRP